MINSVRALFCMAAASIVAGHAATEPLTKEELTLVERVDAVTIPIPGEFFTAMGKAGQPAWGQYLQTGSPATTDSRARIALSLGTLVADGYIAVEAQDGQAVKNIGKEILSLAKKLNVSQSVLGRSGSIGDFADNNDWNALREELESTQNEVKLDMAAQNDDRLVTLVTLGAWIRGVELVSGMTSTAYTPESAKLLRQPAIIDFLVSQIDALPESARMEEPVPAIRAGLQEAIPLVSPEVPSLEDVQKLHQLMQGLCKLINGQVQTP